MITQDQLSGMIADAKARHPFHFENERDEPLSEHHLADIERQRGIRFPETYRHHLMTEGAGDFAFGWVYSPDSCSKWSLWKAHHILCEKQPELLPFSDNGCGDYYCFPIVEGACDDRVVWADHEQDYALTQDECDDFREFIVKLCLNPA